MDVSLFIDPEPAQIDAAIRAGAPTIELHTGAYADAQTPEQIELEFQRIRLAAEYAHGKVVVNAGHGLHYHNTQRIAALPQFHELNIGHALIARALFSGLAKAVSDMKQLMLTARGV
jgi:pyridoxine 5-phosphate synthase